MVHICIYFLLILLPSTSICQQKAAGSCSQLERLAQDEGRSCSPGLQLLSTLRHLQTACSFRHLNHPLITSKDVLSDIVWSNSVSDVSHLFQPSAWCMQSCAAATPGWKARRAMRLWHIKSGSDWLLHRLNLLSQGHAMSPAYSAAHLLIEEQVRAARHLTERPRSRAPHSPAPAGPAASRIVRHREWCTGVNKMLHHSLKPVPRGGVERATPQQEAPSLRHAANMVTWKTARSHVAPSALPRTHQACMVLWTSGTGGPLWDHAPYLEFTGFTIKSERTAGGVWLPQGSCGVRVTSHIGYPGGSQTPWQRGHSPLYSAAPHCQLPAAVLLTHSWEQQPGARASLISIFLSSQRAPGIANLAWSSLCLTCTSSTRPATIRLPCGNILRYGAALHHKAKARTQAGGELTPKGEGWATLAWAKDAWSGRASNEMKCLGPPLLDTAGEYLLACACTKVKTRICTPQQWWSKQRPLQGRPAAWHKICVLPLWNHLISNQWMLQSDWSCKCMSPSPVCQMLSWKPVGIQICGISVVWCPPQCGTHKSHKACHHPCKEAQFLGGQGFACHRCPGSIQSMRLACLGQIDGFPGPAPPARLWMMLVHMLAWAQWRTLSPWLRSSRLHISSQPASVAAFARRRADAGTKAMPCCMAGTALPVSGTFQQKPVKRRKINAVTCEGWVNQIAASSAGR